MGFPFLSYLGMGLSLVALRAVGALLSNQDCASLMLQCLIQDVTAVRIFSCSFSAF